MTWKEAWKRGAQSLQKAGVEEYDLDAWYLLEHVTPELQRLLIIWSRSTRCTIRRSENIWS